MNMVSTILDAVCALLNLAVIVLLVRGWKK